MKQYFCFAFIPVLLAGCAYSYGYNESNSDVYQISPDMFLVSRTGSQYFHHPESPKSEAMRAADQYCHMQNKRIQVLEVREALPPFTPERLPFAEIRFTCN